MPNLTTLETYLSVIACRLQDGRADIEETVEDLGIAINMIKEINNGSIHSTWSADRTDSGSCGTVHGTGACQQASAEEKKEYD